MITSDPNTTVFERLSFVLVETSRAGNVGAAARALKTMGFADLVLVNPRDPGVLSDPEAVAFASGALDVLGGARIVDSMAAALEGCHFAASVSARLREFSPPVWTPRQFAAHVAACDGRPRGTHEGGGDSAQPATEDVPQAPPLHAALVFGNERFGLPNAVVEASNVLINIPANPGYSSLNLAQAIMVLAYEARQAALPDGVCAPSAPAIGFQGEAASVAQIEGMFTHLEQGLVALGFLDPAHPKKLMPRLRRLFARTQLETEEVNILRGMAHFMIKNGSAPRGD
jgi:tRNA/rRNA methyltransferase